MYGAKMIGGSSSDPDDGKEDERPDGGFEPAFFHHLPETLYSDTLQAYELRGCLDLTPGCGDLAKACLLRRVPYVGLGMTDQHCSLLKAQLVEFVKMQMRSEGSTFYSPEWASAADPAAEKKRKFQPDAKPKPEKAPKTSKTKKDQELLEDSDSASEGKKS